MITKLSPLALAVSGMLALASTSALAADSKMAKQNEAISYDKDSILVVYHDNTSKSERLAAQRLVRGYMQDKNSDGIDDKFSALMNGRLAQISLGRGGDVKQAIKMMSAHPAVKYAEPNYRLHTLATPDDTRYGELWGLNNTGQTSGTADADIDAAEAWDISTGSSDVVVAVIDTGVDYNHSDLAGNIWTNPGEIAGNGIDDDGNGVVDDVHGFNAINNSGDPFDDNAHGTHVSGTIGAKGNNANGVVGVNWDVSIIGCKFLDSSGSGSTAGAIACVNYVTDLKVNRGVDVKITNNSWGGGGFSQALKDAIDAGGDAGIMFVAAAGNGAYDNDASPSYPASYDSDAIVAVASTDHNDAMSGFSQYGLTSVDLGAPGSAILSTVPGGGYSSFSGTSMATPHVVGAAALAWSVNPDLDVAEMKELLLSSGDDNAALNGKTVSGKRLNVNNALEAADPSPAFKLNVTPGTQTIEAGASASYEFSVGSVAGWDNTVSLSFSVDPALAGVSLSTDSAMAGDTFTLDVATMSDTAWGDYAIEVTGVDGDIVKSKTVNLTVIPQGLADYPYSNDTPVAIPDNNSEGITSTIEVAEGLLIFGTEASVDITHTWIGDLIVTLTSPTGTEAVLHNRAGGSADDLVESWDLSAFNGESAMGTWTLNVSDNAGADLGTLNSWGLVFSAVGDGTPAAPEAGFDYEVDGLSVSFTNTSSDINDDIVSYSWDFGDGMMSSDANPSHVFAAAGTYTVSLTATDAEDLSNTVTREIEVFQHSIDASATRAYKSRRGSALVDVAWDGAVGDSVIIMRDGQQVAETNNDGRYRDRFSTAATTVTYQVCEATSSLCSDEFVAEF
ncbi:S8 family serine peptidase [Shewanella sp. NIFS-20-20]|uniref:S8 family serine peptidase n=1 Tax=Shewanella sp. NIFS-20-20 TaxID=2853806 RepID=UPI001C45FDB6|nr:S8 family serine peptidase [Shewanella sp. NIFS-20-20]MBV7314110.1 S8 family serine peptidase [Shewanella sp. NIFS-20-20]